MYCVRNFVKAYISPTGPYGNDYAKEHVCSLSSAPPKRKGVGCSRYGC